MIVQLLADRPNGKKGLEFDDSMYLPPRPHLDDSWWDLPTPTRTIRPERPEDGQAKQIARIAWMIAAKRLHESCRSSAWYGRYYVNNELATNDKSVPYLLQCTALVLFDTTIASGFAGSSIEVGPPLALESLEFSSKDRIGWDVLAVMAADFLENMLNVDYGLAPDRMPTFWWDRNIMGWPRHHKQFRRLCALFADFVAVYGCSQSGRGSLIPPGSVLWKYLASRLGDVTYLSINHTDFGLMLYYYHKNHQELEPDEYKAGRTGYTGVLQEMIDELPRVGPHRLQRRLSVDFNEIIPGAVMNPQRRGYLLARVEAVAEKYGLPLCTPKTKIEKPARVENPPSLI